MIFFINMWKIHLRLHVFCICFSISYFYIGSSMCAISIEKRYRTTTNSNKKKVATIVKNKGEYVVKTTELFICARIACTWEFWLIGIFHCYCCWFFAMITFQSTFFSTRFPHDTVLLFDFLLLLYLCRFVLHTQLSQFLYKIWINDTVTVTYSFCVYSLHVCDAYTHKWHSMCSVALCCRCIIESKNICIILCYVETSIANVAILKIARTKCVAITEHSTQFHIELRAIEH